MVDLEQAIKDRKNKVSVLQLLAKHSVPIFISILFLGIVFGGIAPQYFSIKSIKQDTLNSQNKYNMLKQDLSNLEALSNDYQSVVDDLAKIERSFPSGTTSVSKFSLDLEKEAKVYSLEQKSISSGENIEGTEEKKEGSEVVLTPRFVETNDAGQAVFVEIPADLTLSGTYKNFEDYLSSIYKKQNFMKFGQISMSLVLDEGMALGTKLNRSVKGLVTNDEWQGRLLVHGYNFTGNAFNSESFEISDQSTNFDELMEKL